MHIYTGCSSSKAEAAGPPDSGPQDPSLEPHTSMHSAIRRQQQDLQQAAHLEQRSLARLGRLLRGRLQ